MSNEQPPVRKVIPYKSGKRPSTFRRLNIDFVGTALEEALNEQEQLEQVTNSADSLNEDVQIEETENLLPPVTTTPHQSPSTLINHTPTVDEVSHKEPEQSQAVPHISELTKRESPPVTTTPQQEKKVSRNAIAPERDFNRRANSLERDALPSGLFPGSTKKVYDALYLRTIGAIVPVKRVKASRRDLLTWTGIRNLKTIDNHIRYLMAKGLIVRHWELGSNEGSSYEVRLPEEIQNQSPPVPTSGGYPPPDTTSQNSGIPTTQKMGSGGESQLTESITTYRDDKTSFKTKDIKTDDDEAFAGFMEMMRETVREVTGRSPGKFERDRWRELAELLSTELKIAAGRTTVSSVPSFLTEHLRRRLWKKEKRQIDAEKSEERSEPTPKIDASKCPDCFGTGMWYPEGYERGVARCEHKRLIEQLDAETSA